ncbi:Uncharacterised protein g3559 [Pycnogonum litorale]
MSFVELFLENLSWFYIIGLTSSVVVLIFTFIFTKQEKLIINRVRDESNKIINSGAETNLDDEMLPSSEEDQGVMPPSMINYSDENKTDILEFAEHVPAQVKKMKQKVTTKKIWQNMTEEDKRKEIDVQKQQLDDIFNLIQDHGEKFGISTISEMEEQMRLYT